MPKQAQYNINDILSYAVEIFTEQGFASASMEEIIARTQFNRRAFYLEFKSKRGFLHAVLQHYVDTQLSRCQESLVARRETGTVAIDDYFRAYYSLISEQGCLLVDCISELGRSDEQVQTIARHYYDSLQLCFIACLERAQKHQQIRPDVNIEAIALQLTCFTQGFAVSSILQDGEDDVLIAMRQVLSSVSLNQEADT
jgi:AcrR family transcriptional regulator